jgi:hypothetical protein
VPSAGRQKAPSIEKTEEISIFCCEMVRLMKGKQKRRDEI